MEGIMPEGQQFLNERHWACPCCGENISTARVICQYCKGSVYRKLVKDAPGEIPPKNEVAPWGNAELNSHEEEILKWYCEKYIDRTDSLHKKQSKLIGIDRRGGKGYEQLSCERCGAPVYVSHDTESGRCAKCSMVPVISMEGLLTDTLGKLRIKYGLNDIQMEKLYQILEQREEPGPIDFRGLDEAAEDGDGKLREWRESKGLSQSDMAQLLQMTERGYRKTEETGKISSRVRGIIQQLVERNERVPDLEFDKNSHRPSAG